SIDVSTGGPARSVTNLIQAMLKNPNVEVDLHCGLTTNPVLEDFIFPSGRIKFHKVNFLGALKGFSDTVKAQQPEIFHGQGLWQSPVHQMAILARNLHV